MEPILECNHIKKVFVEGSRTHIALQGISLKIHPGDVYGVIGHSGAGKSTLMRLLVGLDSPTSGEVVFQGKSLHKNSSYLSSFRNNIGMVFQHFNLLSSRTAEENIAFPMEIKGWDKEKIKARVKDLLELVGLENKGHLCPSRLSGGEKQRVGIARALACYPKILFCDEATSALDPKSTKEILGLLKELNKKMGITIILITHEMEVIKSLCKRVAVLEKGEIIEDGLVTDLVVAPKKKTTKDFLQSSNHVIPASFFHNLQEDEKILRLSFKGESTSKPVISQMVKAFDVDASILMGWIDYIDDVCFGWLVIKLGGGIDNVKKALHYLEKEVAYCEELSL